MQHALTNALSVTPMSRGLSKTAKRDPLSGYSDTIGTLTEELQRCRSNKVVGLVQTPCKLQPDTKTKANTTGTLTVGIPKCPTHMSKYKLIGHNIH